MVAVRRNVISLGCCVFLSFMSLAIGLQPTGSSAIAHFGEADDVVSRVVLADAVVVGTVTRVTTASSSSGGGSSSGGKLFDATCVEMVKVECLKGRLEGPIVACTNGGKGKGKTGDDDDDDDDDGLLVEEEKFILFLHVNDSIDVVSDDDDDDFYYLMSSPPLPYSVQDEVEILNFLDDPSVGQPPSITATEKTLINESLGDRVSINCSYSGFPAPRVQWRKNGVVLQSSEDVMIESNGNLSVLKFGGLHVDHNGDYQCIVYNVFGHDNITFTVESYKMHALPCPDNSYCFGHGVCFLSGGLMLCECREGFSGQRCQLADGESNQPTTRPVESPRSLQTLMLVISIVVATTGVIIFVYAAIRSFCVGSKYKKIKVDEQNQQNVEAQNQVLEQRNTEPSATSNGNVGVQRLPPEYFQVRERLDGTSTPSNLDDDVLTYRSRSLGDDDPRSHVAYPNDINDINNINNIINNINNINNNNRTHYQGDQTRTNSVGGVIEPNDGQIVPIKISII